MKHLTALAAALALAATALPSVAAADPASLTGEDAEARTAEAFAGERVTNDDAGTTGRQSVLAWKVTSGSFQGVRLDGLTVVAAVAGDSTPGLRQRGGEAPSAVTAVITVDARATVAQRQALVALALKLSGGLITDVVRVDTQRVRFATTQRYIEVTMCGESVTLT